MNFYKLTDIITHDELYFNPKKISYYAYTDDSVIIETDSIRIRVSKFDFDNMMILEGAREY